MKNVTVSMDEELADRIDAVAAKSGKSVSSYLVEAARERVERDEKPETSTDHSRQVEALKRLLAGPKWSIMENGRMPTADERNARR